MNTLTNQQTRSELFEMDDLETKIITPAPILTRTYTLPSFNAIVFIGAIGQLAEAANHHPDLKLFGYKHVTIELSTHSEGGLTRRDFDLAQQIQALPHRKTN